MGIFFGVVKEPSAMLATLLGCFNVEQQRLSSDTLPVAIATNNFISYLNPELQVPVTRPLHHGCF